MHRHNNFSLRDGFRRYFLHIFQISQTGLLYLSISDIFDD
jgi:hypothetical protein